MKALALRIERVLADFLYDGSLVYVSGSMVPSMTDFLASSGRPTRP